MELIYHTEICQKVLQSHFSQRAFETIIEANHRLDGIFTGLIGHPEYHFDDNKIEESWEYVNLQHELIFKVLTEDGETENAWKAFGRLLHVVQDFYSHSNYVELWLKNYNTNNLPPVDKINGLDDEILNSPELHTAVVYYPLEALTYFPFMRPLLRPLLPKDSHANMNLDSPERGLMFPFSIEAALQRSTHEYEKTIKQLSPTQILIFQDN